MKGSKMKKFVITGTIAGILLAGGVTAFAAEGFGPGNAFSRNQAIASGICQYGDNVCQYANDACPNPDCPNIIADTPSSEADTITVSDSAASNTATGTRICDGTQARLRDGSCGNVKCDGTGYGNGAGQGSRNGYSHHGGGHCR